MDALTYVHGHTTDTWPAVSLGLVFVVSATGLQDGLVNTTTTSNNTFIEHTNGQPQKALLKLIRSLDEEKQQNQTLYVVPKPEQSQNYCEQLIYSQGKYANFALIASSRVRP